VFPTRRSQPGVAARRGRYAAHRREERQGVGGSTSASAASAPSPWRASPTTCLVEIDKQSRLAGLWLLDVRVPNVEPPPERGRAARALHHRLFAVEDAALAAVRARHATADLPAIHISADEASAARPAAGRRAARVLELGALGGYSAYGWAGPAAARLLITIEKERGRAELAPGARMRGRRRGSGPGHRRRALDVLRRSSPGSMPCFSTPTRSRCRSTSTGPCACCAWRIAALRQRVLQRRRRRSQRPHGQRRGRPGNTTGAPPPTGAWYRP